MAASWAAKLSSWSGFGCSAWGAEEASGGIDIRDARGADVCGSNVASGSQGAIREVVSNTATGRLYLDRRTGLPGGAGSARASLGRVSAALCLGASTFRDFSPGAPRRSGLLVRDTKVSLVVTCILSVRRSSTARLDGLGFPDAVRLWDVRG